MKMCVSLETLTESKRNKDQVFYVRQGEESNFKIILCHRDRARPSFLLHVADNVCIL